MPVIPSQRALFDIPEDVAYFNCAYQGPQLKASSAAMIEGLRHKERPWQVAPTDFFSQPEQLRELLGQITDTKADNFALMPSASYGLATAAQALSPHLKPGDEILMIAETFPSTYLTWKRVSEETGASIKTVKTPPDHDWTSAILEAITPAT
ncbi:MAG TPA: aminotransferase, partial [Hyphomonadaceae bacterium]|nr:aminotransferase [Hyphomonadaceae bacterium]